MSIDFITGITVFVLALLVGAEVIGKVPATLHTPLMSGANAVHGVVLIGVIIVAGEVNSPWGIVVMGFAAALASINVVGGYLVTDRMLGMFHHDADAR
ncbi:NAD(P) transhydrogenase subunit alpha [Williamsia sp.]|uniref:NAD(P) transhydrogenase subunit alpha n=1 Tax=Williamsia sp. TaxID=1872085 RepID=UPI001A1F2519|nr:NAD(P) transhydrogenase subunit alpha [Williamsia sp.]MBJ7287924.1 NAD(P) transhydrogenase subunit alpha [Williamsia sp.]